MTGLRERKKEAARLALHEAALRLVSEHGPDSVTVEAIAEAASMSRRTFSNYFANKEEAVFYRDALRSQELIDLVRGRPADESPLTAYNRAMNIFFADSDVNVEQQIQRRLVSQYPSLAAYRVGNETHMQQALAEAFAERLPDRSEFTAAVLAALALAALRAARTQWINNQNQSMREVLARVMEHVRE